MSLQHLIYHSLISSYYFILFRNIFFSPFEPVTALFFF